MYSCIFRTYSASQYTVHAIYTHKQHTLSLLADVSDKVLMLGYAEIRGDTASHTLGRRLALEHSYRCHVLYIFHFDNVLQ